MDSAKLLNWVAIVGKIGMAAAPLLTQLAKLIGLIGEAEAKGLTVEEVEEEIRVIIADSASMDAVENKLAGLGD